MDFKELLVVMPHCGILIPVEIPFDALSATFPEAVKDVDWYTNYLTISGIYWEIRRWNFLIAALFLS
jgi:hypothetical protein